MQRVNGSFPLCWFLQLAALAKSSSEVDLCFCCNSRGGCQVYWHTVASQEQVTELSGFLGLFCI